MSPPSMAYYYLIVLIILSIFSIHDVLSAKCIQWTHKYVDPDGPSMIYSETISSTDGIGTQLSLYALLWQMRRNYNVDVFISQNCFDQLSAVFTPKSLKDLPILEEYFCNSEEIKFEFFGGNFQSFADKKSLRVGRTLYFWPSVETVTKILKKNGQGHLPKGDINVGLSGYKPDDHANSPAHAKLRDDYVKWMKRKLVFQPIIEARVHQTLDDIARKLDLKTTQVNYIGIHNRRSKEFNEHYKKLYNQKPLKKSYFYDAMEEMRESYDNVAFLYVSDDMKWGRKNLKDKENDLYFAGQEDAAYDFVLLCQCNHTIVSRGAFSYWASLWTGGEYYTEYGSIVPHEVNDIINEEAMLERKRNGDEAFVYGSSKTGDAEGLLFPDIKLEGEEVAQNDNEESSFLSWLW